MSLAADGVGLAPEEPPVDVVGGDSPVDVSVPFWITACVRLQPPRRRNGAVVESAADKVLTAAQVLLADRIKAQGDAVVELDRTKIARWCGYDSPKKASWLFDYLVLIGFLVIDQQYIRGRRGRARDTFAVFTQPPVGYVGPRTYAELDHALADPTFPRTLFVALPKTRRSGSRYPDGTQDHDLGAQMGPKTDKPAGQGLGTQMGTILQIDRSSISDREIEGSIEPVPGGSAKPPATGMEERRAAAVRELVRRLPWAEWANRRAGQRFRLTPADADAVQEAIGEAIASAGITLEQAAAIGQAALGEAKKTPVAYVVGAFRPPKLERRLRALGVEPLSDDPLPLPGDPDEDQATPPTPARRREASAGADPGERESAKRVLPACPTCEAHEGEGRAHRYVTGEDGREHPCPDCLPTTT